jgi:hypothetical protein
MVKLSRIVVGIASPSGLFLTRPSRAIKGTLALCRTRSSMTPCPVVRSALPKLRVSGRQLCTSSTNRLDLRTTAGDRVVWVFQVRNANVDSTSLLKPWFFFVPLNAIDMCQVRTINATRRLSHSLGNI